MKQFSSKFKDKILLLSGDDKSKIFIGTSAVSRYVNNNKFYFKKNKVPINFDHDFPLMGKLKLNMSGFLKFKSSGNYKKDRFKR